MEFNVVKASYIRMPVTLAVQMEAISLGDRLELIAFLFLYYKKIFLGIFIVFS